MQGCMSVRIFHSSLEPSSADAGTGFILTCLNACFLSSISSLLSDASSHELLCPNIQSLSVLVQWAASQQSWSHPFSCSSRLRHPEVRPPDISPKAWNLLHSANWPSQLSLPASGAVGVTSRRAFQGCLLLSLIKCEVPVEAILLCCVFYYLDFRSYSIVSVDASLIGLQLVVLEMLVLFRLYRERTVQTSFLVPFVLFEQLVLLF